MMRPSQFQPFNNAIAFINRALGDVTVQGVVWGGAATASAVTIETVKK